MPQLPSLAPLGHLLDRARRVLITTHENPDADAVGSVTALARDLRLRGREVRIVVVPSLPSFLGFLDGESLCEAFDPARHADLASWPDLWLLVDASEPARLGPLQAAFAASKALKVCLDHHRTPMPTGFDHVFLRPEAAASAELVYELLAARTPRLPLPVATALYAGLVDDTGGFRFDNTSPKVHRMAAELLELGVEPSRTHQALYHQGRPQRLLVQGRAFASLCFQEGQRYARMSLSQADLAACGANHDDLEGLVNKPLELRGVEVSALLCELPDGRWKLSLRSRERVDVNAVCRLFGGGGHRLASGAKLDGPLQSAQNGLDAAVLAKLQEDLPEA